MKYRARRTSNTTDGQHGSSLRRKIFNSNIFIVALLLLLIFSFVKVTKGIVLRYKISQEIKQLEEQLTDLKDKTDKMNQLVTYLGTDEYIEKEARVKLNLRKPGETQVNLAKDQDDASAPIEVDDLSNVEKWFNYFFTQ